MRTHSNSGAVLFLAATAAGGALLLTGLTNTAPERTGVRLPQRNVGAYTAAAPLHYARSAPDQGGYGLPAETEPALEQVQDFLSTADAAANSALDRGHLFIQLYGGIQRITGRRMVEDAVDENTVVKLSTGALNFVKPDSTAQPAESVEANAAATADLAQALPVRDIRPSGRDVDEIIADMYREMEL